MDGDSAMLSSSKRCRNHGAESATEPKALTGAGGGVIQFTAVSAARIKALRNSTAMAIAWGDSRWSSGSANHSAIRRR